jgi:RNA polymerase sigma factor (sigma-70 family)
MARGRAVPAVRNEPVLHAMSTPVPEPHAADVALVRAVLAGDRAAADRLAERLQCIGRFLRTRGRQLCGNLDDADLLDIGQDVVTKILARLPDYEGRAAIESWVFAFCEGEVRNVVRRRLRERARTQELDTTDLAAADAAEPEDHADLFRCMDRLATDEVLLLRQKHHDGLRLEDIAARARVKLNTIKSRYYRVLVRLRHCLERRSDQEAS